jgi:hypothetical protein
LILEVLQMAKRTLKMKMIRDFAKFKRSWTKHAKDPGMCAFHYMIALMNVEEDFDRAHAMVSIMVHKDYTREDLMSPSGLKLWGNHYNWLSHVKYNPNTPRSYLGGIPEKMYELEGDDLEMTVLKVEKKGKHCTVYLYSSGRDRPASGSMEKNKRGQWKLKGTSTWVMSVMPPIDDDF